MFYGDVDAAEDMDTCLSDIAYLHIKDKAGERKEWNFPALGEGYVDFDTIFRKLDEAHNDAPLSIEIEFTPNGAGSLENVNKAIETSAAYLRARGFEL